MLADTLTETLIKLFSQGRALDAAVGRRAGRIVTWAEWQAEAAAWHLSFAAQPGQRFALYVEDDTLTFAAALFGAWHAGKTVVLPGDALPATLVRLEVDGLAGNLPGALQAPSAAEVRWTALRPEAGQLVLHTSGSSGAPLALNKRFDQLFSEVDALEQAFGARVDSAEVLATVSHQHIYGLLFRVLWPLAAGRVLHAERLAYLEALPTLLQPSGKALLVASPAHLKRLPALTVDPRLCAIFSSGGPLPDAAVPEAIAQLGHAPIEVFGSSETGGIAWRQRSQPTSTWQALPGVQWRIEGECLQVRSAHLDGAGWQQTADRAAARGDAFELLGRADQIIKIEEKRVSLAAVEQALQATEYFEDLRVLALPATGLAREQLAVVAQPTSAAWGEHDRLGKRAFTETLRAHLRDVLDAPSLPRRWRFVSAMPHNAQGKLTQTSLLALFDPRRPQFRVIERSAAQAQLRIAVDAGLPQFQGHFPHTPILPGVAQLEWVVLLGRELFAPLAPYGGVEALKFQRVIQPGDVLTLMLDYKPGRLSFTYESVAGRHASGRILLGATES